MPRNSPSRAGTPSRSRVSAGSRRSVTVANWRTVVQTYSAADAPRPPGSQALHHPDDLGVEAQARVEAEIAPVGDPEPDGPGPARGQRAENLPGRVHRVRGQAQGLAEDVGVPAGQGGEQGSGGRRAVARGAGRAGPEHPVDNLVHRAVPAQGEHEPEILASGSLRDVRGVSPVACLHNIEVEFRSQRVRDDLPPDGRGGGGVRVDDQQRAHALRLGGSRENATEPPDVARGRGGPGRRVGADPARHRAGRAWTPRQAGPTT